MTSHVLDASVVLAFLFGENGSDAARPLLRTATMSAVNYSEVVEKMLARDIDRQATMQHLALLRLDVRHFGEADAADTSALRKKTAGFGLSFADRACRSLARTLACPAYTADRVWAELDIGVDIRLIR